MRESHEQATPLVHLAPRHKLTLQYLALFDELD
jgi:chromosome partitioning protein